ncbi:MAG: HAD-IA family hydrolase [Bacteroidales bacterium]|jgi:putative hydrolase of the HAD superfamily|nr:HAD-IA family hydrolase [Bacteroidales bacterium]
MLPEIKNIIFDLGGVLYDIRYENIADTFRLYGLQNFEKLYAQAGQAEEIDLFEEGKISPEQFRDFLRSLSPQKLTDSQIDNAWNAILIDLPEVRLKLLKELEKKYRLFLFSNTNAINCIEFERFVTEKWGENIFETHFEKIYYSHTLGIKKPKPEAFQQICFEQNLKPAETLFIDDTERHLLGAQKAGLQTYWLHNENLENCQIIKKLLQ